MRSGRRTEKDQTTGAMQRLLVDGVQDYALFALDRKGRVLVWNAGAERIYGYRADAIVGQDFSITYTQEDVDEGRPAGDLRVVASESRVQLDAWRVRSDGSRFWANTVLTPMRDDVGGLVGSTAAAGSHHRAHGRHRKGADPS